MNAIVLAGGLGIRLRPLTNKTPKPAIKVGGKPIIRHVLDWLEDVGFDDILVKLHYMPDKILEAIGNDKYVKPIIERKLTPTAYFLKKHKKDLEDEFLVTNGDTISHLELTEFIEFHMVKPNLATVFTHHDALHTGGTYIFDKEILNYVKKDMDILHLMAVLVEADIPINLYFSDAQYFDTADLAKLQKARDFYEK